MRRPLPCVSVHVVITGASSGIGEALAREYLSRGASVTLVARRKDRLDAIARGHDGKVHVVEADLAQVDTADAWVDGAIRALGPIDVLVNNAGVQIVHRTVDATWEEGERQIRLNTLTPLKLTKRVLPEMLARRSGAIVDVSSSAALAPTPGMFFYSASKAAIGAASEALRGELRKTGVHVVTVYPGPVRTAMEATGRAAYEETWAMRTFTPTGEASVLARKIVRAVERRRARVIYPAFYALTRLFPNLTRFVMDRMTPPLKALPQGDAK